MFVVLAKLLKYVKKISATNDSLPAVYYRLNLQGQLMSLFAFWQLSNPATKKRGKHLDLEEDYRYSN